jgi:hypothetical protein
MLHPEEIRARTLEFQIQPSPSGIGFELLITKGRSKSEHRCCYRETLDKVLGLLRHTTLEFYQEELDALRRRIEADPDVAEECCPECEETRAE